MQICNEEKTSQSELEKLDLKDTHPLINNEPLVKYEENYIVTDQVFEALVTGETDMNQYDDDVDDDEYWEYRVSVRNISNF